MGGRGAGGSWSKNWLEGALRQNALWGSWTILGSRASAAPETREPGQSAHAGSTQGVFPWWMLCYLCFTPSRTRSAMRSAIGRPYLALSRIHTHTHTGRSSQPPRSKLLRVLNRAIVVLWCFRPKTPLKQARNKDGVVFSERAEEGDRPSKVACSGHAPHGEPLCAAAAQLWQPLYAGAHREELAQGRAPTLIAWIGQELRKFIPQAKRAQRSRLVAGTRLHRVTRSKHWPNGQKFSPNCRKSVFAGALDNQRKKKRGWKTQGRGKHTIKPLPKNGFGPPPPHLWYVSPPPPCLPISLFPR